MTQPTVPQVIEALQRLKALAMLNPATNLEVIDEFIRRVQSEGIAPPEGYATIPKSTIARGWNIVASSRHLGVLIDPENLAEILTAAKESP